MCCCGCGIDLIAVQPKMSGDVQADINAPAVVVDRRRQHGIVSGLLRWLFKLPLIRDGVGGIGT